MAFNATLTEGAQRAKNFEASFLGQNQSEIANLYNKWAKNGYDSDQVALHHQGRHFIIEALETHFRGDKFSAKVLDVAAGTGLVAETLREGGFCLIDALDGSQEMLDVAKTKDLYKNCLCMFMKDAGGAIENDYYDIQVSLGAIGAGHLETGDFQQMFRTTKPGGMICISGVKSRWDSNPEYCKRMRGAITELEISGRLKVLEERVVKKYYFFKKWDSGILILVQKLK